MERFKDLALSEGCFGDQQLSNDFTTVKDDARNYAKAAQIIVKRRKFLVSAFGLLA
jgi:hypothetical protein